MIPRDAAAIVRGVLAGEVSAVEVSRDFVARADRSNLNCFIGLDCDRWLAEAMEVDRRLRHGEDLPLAGVPVAVKDTFDIAGLPTTGGTAFLDRVPAHDAELVARLRSAGAVIAAKANLHELAYGSTSENPHHGNVHNPVDPARIAGGSSGGSAAAVGAGLVAAALGTDTAGSVRCPASFCGVHGLKSGEGGLSQGGCLPLARSLDSSGVFATDAGSLSLVASVLLGDPVRAAPAPGRVRLGVPRDHYFERLSVEVRDTVARALDTLSRGGVDLVDVRLPEAAAAASAALLLLAGEATREWRSALERNREQLGWDVRVNLVGGLAVSDPDLELARSAQPVARAAFARALAGVDALVAPAMPSVAPEAGDPMCAYGPDDAELVGLATVRMMGPVNFAGLPAVSVPAGRAGGLPVGLQLIGPKGGEMALLTLSAGMSGILSGLTAG
ncbi:MAG: amidase [Candidatus Dormibacteria bacterium]